MNCSDINRTHKQNDMMFLSVKTSSPKKYQVSGMNIRYPIPKVRNLIDHSSIYSYNVIVACANSSDTIGPNSIAM
jgi:hypothetical protein